MATFKALVKDVFRVEVPFPGCWTGVALVCGQQNILIDSGGCAETVDSCIVPALRELGLTLESIDVLALTHTHGDHVGGAARMKALNPRLKLAAYAESRERIENPLAYSRQIRARFPEHSPKPPDTLDGLPLDIALLDGEQIGPLRLIHTPGHDTDTVCYLDERTGTLITGDSLQLNGTVSQGCALLMNLPGYQGSLRKLMNMPISNIVCGHPYLPLGAEAIGREAALRYLTACAECVAHDRGYINALLDAGITDDVTIARMLIAAVGGIEPDKLFLPLYTVHEYLDQRSQQA